MSKQQSQIAGRLVQLGREYSDSKPRSEWFTGDAAVDAWLTDLDTRPHVFVLGCLMMRQMDAQRAWRIPYEMYQRTGKFEFEDLRRLTPARALKVLTKPKPLHRFNTKISEDLCGVIRLLGERYGGDASRIWVGNPSSALVVFRFLELPGCGPKIATMAANLLARDFGIPMSDHYSIDVSVDVHVRRTLTRLGLVADGCSNDEIVYRARAMHPEYPGLLDTPAWEIGHNWCRPTRPECGQCPMKDLCPSAEVGPR